MLAVVIILGVLIVLSLGALVTGVLLGMGRSDAKPAEIYETVLQAAPGARIAGTDVVGNRLAVRVEDDAGGAIVIVDPASGRVVGRIRAGR